jgi:hypothetical protein
MEFSLLSSMQLLSRTPKILSVWLSGLPPHLLTANEGPDTWSPHDVIGHLIVCEQSNFITRIRIVLSSTGEKMFAPLNMQAHVAICDGKPTEELLHTFQQLRQENLLWLSEQGLSGIHLSLTGMHPKVGAVTVRQIIATWVSHDLTHISQVARVIARQHKELTGPFHEFIGILK